MATYCVGCGYDISESRVKRTLYTDASHHVKPLWCKLFDEELEDRGMEPLAHRLVTSTTGKMCRRCFTVFERCTKLLDSIKQDVVKAVETFQQNGLLTVSEETVTDCASAPPPPKRLAIATNSASPAVVTQVFYSKPSTYVLTPSRKKIGKALARRCNFKVASECLKVPMIRQYIVKKIGKFVRAELCKLCSDKHLSILRNNSAEALKEFDWDEITDEFLTYAPILMSILRASTETKKPRINTNAVIVMCMGLLLKHRFIKMCLIQRIVSIILYAGNADKQVFNRLQKLNICMSHQTTIKLVDMLGSDFDSKVHQWRDSLISALDNVTVTNELPLSYYQAETVDTSTNNSEESSSEVSYESFCSVDAPSVSPFTSEDDTTQEESNHEESTLPIETSLGQIVESASCIAASVPTSRTEVSNQSESCTTTCTVSTVSRVDSTNTANSDTFSLAGDNLDTNVNPRFRRTDNHKGQSLHYFHCLAIRDRISVFSQLPITPCHTCINSPEKMALQLLPTAESDSALMDVMIMIVSRVLVTYMPFFQFSCSDVVNWHKEHQYYKEMSSKSDVVPLGVLMLNENKGDEMIQILQHLQQYIPVKEYDDEAYMPNQHESVKTTNVLMHKLLFGGDQLTVARTRGAQTAMSNDLNAFKRLEGFIPVIQDWHAKVILLEVIWKYYYNPNSATEHGTLYQLRNKLNRSNVVKKPKSNFNACDDFIETVIVGHILAAALKSLEISSIEDQPSAKVIGISSPENLWTCTKEERKAILHSVCERIVKRFIKFSFNNFPKSRNHKDDDEVHNYSCHLLSIGCFYLVYKDAIKEGDGERVLDCWRYLLPIFHNSGRRNYSNEALHFLCQYHQDLPPQQAQQLLYSRFVNTRGVRGRNIPLDLHQEHLNKLCKDCVKGLGSNKTKQGITRCSKALGILHDLLKNFDENNHVVSANGAHHSPSYKQDLNLILEELQQTKVFDIVPNRKHKSFKNPKNMLHAKSFDEIAAWVSEHLKKRYCVQNFD